MPYHDQSYEAWYNFEGRNKLFCLDATNGKVLWSYDGGGTVAIQEAAKKIGSTTGEPEGWRRAKVELLMSAYVARGRGRPSSAKRTW